MLLCVLDVVCGGGVFDELVVDVQAISVLRFFDDGDYNCNP